MIQRKSRDLQQLTPGYGEDVTGALALALSIQRASPKLQSTARSFEVLGHDSQLATYLANPPEGLVMVRPLAQGGPMPKADMV